jgi:hypothetical protein
MARQHSRLEQAQGSQVIGPHQCFNGTRAGLFGITWLTEHLSDRA